MKIYRLAPLLLPLAACNPASAPVADVASNNMIGDDITEVPDETMPANAAANANSVDPD